LPTAVAASASMTNGGSATVAREDTSAFAVAPPAVTWRFEQRSESVGQFEGLTQALVNKKHRRHRQRARGPRAAHPHPRGAAQPAPTHHDGKPADTPMAVHAVPTGAADATPNISTSTARSGDWEASRPRAGTRVIRRSVHPLASIAESDYRSSENAPGGYPNRGSLEFFDTGCVETQRVESLKHYRGAVSFDADCLHLVRWRRSIYQRFLNGPFSKW
jgi:hypothetical protein